MKGKILIEGKITLYQLGGGLGAEPDELEEVTELSLDPDRQQKMGGWP